MLGTGNFRDIHSGEGERLVGETVTGARERKRLSLCITQEEGRRYHHLCSRSTAGLGTGQMDRNRHQLAEGEDNSAHHREQQLVWERKAVVIQRAWRTALDRKSSWQEGPKVHTHHHRGTVPLEDVFAANLTTEELGQNLMLVGLKCQGSLGIL
ncbi:uncharacterized protein LOC143483370 [Brachyhypopomus gauderio]|uniref:uncharacterized protein LOC143483370 n=1 Tax=Brachyhypopomus gauderio TaxID=698409 RepID=UPI004042C545